MKKVYLCLTEPEKIMLDFIYKKAKQVQVKIEHSGCFSSYKLPEAEKRFAFTPQSQSELFVRLGKVVFFGQDVLEPEDEERIEAFITDCLDKLITAGLLSERNGKPEKIARFKLNYEYSELLIKKIKARSVQTVYSELYDFISWSEKWDSGAIRNLSESVEGFFGSGLKKSFKEAVRKMVVDRLGIFAHVESETKGYWLRVKKEFEPCTLSVKEEEWILYQNKLQKNREVNMKDTKHEMMETLKSRVTFWLKREKEVHEELVRLDQEIKSFSEYFSEHLSQAKPLLSREVSEYNDLLERRDELENQSDPVEMIQAYKQVMADVEAYLRELEKKHQQEIKQKQVDSPADTQESKLDGLPKGLSELNNEEKVVWCLGRWFSYTSWVSSKQVGERLRRLMGMQQVWNAFYGLKSKTHFLKSKMTEKSGQFVYQLTDEGKAKYLELAKRL